MGVTPDLTQTEQRPITPPTKNLDITPPATPQNFGGIAVSESQINLAWDASRDNVSAIGYKIFRNNIEIGSTISTRYSNIHLTPSTSYSYKIVAYDIAGNLSSPSKTISIKTPLKSPKKTSTPTTPPTTQQQSSTPTPTPTPTLTQTPTPPAGQTYTVTITSNGAINPNALSIHIGDKVNFIYTNPGDEIVLTFSPQPPSNMKLDHETTTRSYTFLNANTYTYHKSGSATQATIQVSNP